jgi:hypothetical protein
MKHGIYLLRYKSGGFSVAAVGYLSDGRNWWAATNYTNKTVCADWSAVESASLVATDLQIVGALNDLAEAEDLEVEID